MSDWFVYEPDPFEGAWPTLYGPFENKEKAEEYANLLHPDDMSGNTVVLPLTRVDG